MHWRRDRRQQDAYGRHVNPDLPRCRRCRDLPVRRLRPPRVHGNRRQFLGDPHHPDGLCVMCSPTGHGASIDDLAQARPRWQHDG